MKFKHNLYVNILTNVNIYIYFLIWGGFCHILGGLSSGWLLSGWLMSGWLLSVLRFNYVNLLPLTCHLYQKHQPTPGHCILRDSSPLGQTYYNRICSPVKILSRFI